MTAKLHDNLFAEALEAIRPDRNLHHVQLRKAAAALDQGRFELATALTDIFLQAHPVDISALNLKAEIATRCGNHRQAEALLSKGLELAPTSLPLRFAYVNALLRLGKSAAALNHAEQLIAQAPRNPLFRPLKPLTLEKLGEYAKAAALWRELTEDYPAHMECRFRLAYALRAVGERDECIKTFRDIIARDPTLGEARWALANLKTFHFTGQEVGEMEALLARTDLETLNRTFLHFTLGRAYADEKHYAKSFSHYAKGNALQRLNMPYDPGLWSTYVARCKAVFTPGFFRSRRDWGCPDASPIFIVGMLRSGSTLVEQILGSHSQIEGLGELVTLSAISQELEQKLTRGRAGDFPAALAQLNLPKAKRLGEQYIESIRPHRKVAHSRFTDKMGANYAHVGLLQLILPQAKIVDVRRHPLACGWSIFAQLFGEGHSFAYNLADIGRLYRDYMQLMAHFDSVLPGKVYGLSYEALIADPEEEIRRLLDFLGLPFEDACLRFHKSDRVVNTVSSEQVRTPLYLHANEQWVHYEPWLGPLKAALGGLV